MDYNDTDYYDMDIDDPENSEIPPEEWDYMDQEALIRPITQFEKNFWKFMGIGAVLCFLIFFCVVCSESG
jgi:hypothetical protein